MSHFWTHYITQFLVKQQKRMNKKFQKRKDPPSLRKFLLQVQGNLGERVGDAQVVATLLDRPRAHALNRPLLLHVLYEFVE